MGHVTPLFEKNDEFKKENYRPVTVLPVLNNIYEKLLAAQLRDLSSDSVGFHQLLQKVLQLREGAVKVDWGLEGYA